MDVLWNNWDRLWKGVGCQVFFSMTLNEYGSNWWSGTRPAPPRPEYLISYIQ
jgi:Tfp pilus assembly protein PilX